MNVPAPLLTLPPELTERIAAFLRVTDCDTDDGDGPSAEIDSATSMSASEMSLDDFRAFRLTCKDVYLKTFKLFGRYYFATFSVGFTRASLNRLRDLANYRNLFGLTLSEFPSHLTVTAHRLLPESHIARIYSVSAPRGDAQAVIATITLLCELEIEDYNVPGTYDPDMYAIARRYKKAVASQRSLTTSMYDVNTIARSIATFPNFCSVALDSYDKSWGVEDWEEIAGFDRRLFTSFGDIDSGLNNLEFAFNRILQAIAQAEKICQAAGRTLNLCSLNATGPDGDEGWCPDSHQNIKLQSLAVQPFDRVALQSALSRLTSLSLDIYDYVTPNELDNSFRKIEQVLQLLLSSPELRELAIAFVDSGETVYDDLSNMSQPGNTWAGDENLSMISEVERSNCLQRLDLFCVGIVDSRISVERLVKKHTLTLEAFSLDVLVLDPAGALPDIPAVRDRYKSLLRIVAGCALLEHFSFYIETEELRVAHFDMYGREWMMRRVHNMIMNDTGPDDDCFWVDKSEAGGEDDDED